MVPQEIVIMIKTEPGDCSSTYTSGIDRYHCVLNNNGLRITDSDFFENPLKYRRRNEGISAAFVQLNLEISTFAMLYRTLYKRVSTLQMTVRAFNHFEFDLEPAALHQVSANHFTHTVSRNWSVKEYPNGGYISALGGLSFINVSND